MPTLEITGVAEAVRDWNSEKGGPMKGYRIDLKAADGSEEMLVEWSRKATSPPPTVGQSVEGAIENTQYGKRFRQAPTGNFNGPRPEDPKRSARIQRMHSQDMALQTIRLARDADLIPYESKMQTAADLLDAVKKLADWYDKDADAAGQRA